MTFETDTDTETELRRALAAWRRHIPAVTTLADPVDPARDHVVGDPSAPAIVEYGDYQCVECAQAHRLRGMVGDPVQAGHMCFVFRHFPLVDAHPRALRAALAVEAAAAQGRFEDMHDLLMASQTLTDNDGHPHLVLTAPLDEPGLLHAARHLGLDLDRFRATMEDPVSLERIVADFRSGLRSGVNGTPSFYLAGERQDVVAPEEVLERVSAMLAAG